jgi:hypothetical protein
MKIMANPTAPVNSMSNFCEATAKPVIDGFMIKKFKIKIAETMFAMNNEVFMVY